MKLKFEINPERHPDVLVVFCDRPYIRLCKSWFFVFHNCGGSYYLGFLAID